ncbi:MAG: peptidyl-prolyl cis-trans isomerase [Xanthomonadales bacterium]|nr:peptidyl-prolyl cis-trans isomerase [Xanthomonadales bacterium]
MILRFLLILFSFVPTAWSNDDCFPPEVLPDNLFPTVRMETSLGDVVVELNRMRAPATVNNFLGYVLDGSYDGTIFHRVISGFVVQGGGYGPDFSERGVNAPVLNESGNGLQNDMGTIAMARFDDPHSATRQFYFNLGDNSSLDPNSRNWGYTVFGTVLEGRDVLESMAEVTTDYSEALGATDVPVDPLILIRVSITE